MFRYVADEFNKLFNSSTKSQQEEQTKHTVNQRNPPSSANATDVNNNNIGAVYSRTKYIVSKQGLPGQAPANNNQVNVLNLSGNHTESFFDEFDWFQVKKHSNNQNLR